MKKKFAKTLAVGLALAMTFSSVTGCGKDSGSDEASAAQDGSAAAEDTGSSGEAAATSEIDYRICPWVLSRELSDAEVLELPEGAGMYGLSFPVTADELLGISYEPSGVVTLQDDMLDDQTYSVTLYNGADDFIYPQLTFDEEGMTFGEALEKNLWRLSDGCDYTSLGFSEDDYYELCNSYDEVEGAYLFLDMMTAIYGAPNYVSYYGGTDFNERTKEENAEYLVDTYLHPEAQSDDLSFFIVDVGWQFEEFGIEISISDGTRYSKTSGFYSDPSNYDMSFFYLPIEKGTLEEFETEAYGYTSGSNIVKELIAEKNKVFGDVEYLTPDEKVVEFVKSGGESASTTEEEETASSTNFVEVDRDFSEEANDAYMKIGDSFYMGEHYTMTGTTTGVFKVGDTVYVQLSDGRVIEGEISLIEQNRKIIDETVSGEEFGIEVEGIERNDEYETYGATMVLK